MKKKLLTLLLVTVICLTAIALLSSCGKKYTVTFDPNGGEIDGELTIQVREGQKIPEPVATREGYAVSGWYTGSKSTLKKWDFENDVVTGDITLKATWRSTVECVHDFVPTKEDRWIVADCIKNGKEYYACQICRMQEIKTIKATGHDVQTEVIPETCAKTGYTRLFCANNCSYYEEQKINLVKPTGDHNYDIDGDGFDDYKTVVTPTDYAPGQQACFCTVCGNGVYETLAPIKTDSELKDLAIDNYEFKGTPYVNIATYGGISASSYYTICLGSMANDGKLGTYWGANTLSDGSEYTGDTVTLTFDEYYEVGALSLVVPFYSSWELGETFYVSYKVEAFVKDESLPEGGKWIDIGTMSDKDAESAGMNGKIFLELENSIQAKEFRFTVDHASRYASAMIYEVEVYANVTNERLSADMLGQTTASVNGKYNAYALGAGALTDGDMNSAWFTDWRHVGEAYAILEFPGERYVAAVQFATLANVGRAFDLSVWEETAENPDGAWRVVNSFEVPSKEFATGNAQYITVLDGENTRDACFFTQELNCRTKKIKLEITKEPTYWDSKVLTFVPYTVIERAVSFMDNHDTGIRDFTGCRHTNTLPYKENGEIVTVAPTCEKAGYTIMQCLSCKTLMKSDGTHATGHVFGEYTETTAATATTLGVKTATCTNGCGTTRTRNFTANYKEAEITKYFKNAPAAWVQTYDDGNYLEACKWSVEQFKKYNYKATMNMAICYSDGLVAEWNEIFSTGFFDLGSHSYNHAGIYAGPISEGDMQSDIDNAHFWFMSKYKGQQILTFATPNGTTSEGTAEYVTHLMASGRNGSLGMNLVEDLKNAIKWGNLFSYPSKSNETEGDYILVDKDGKVGGFKAVEYVETVTDEETGEETKVGTGEYYFEWVGTKGGYKKADITTWSDEGGEYILVHYISATGTFSKDSKDQYKFIKKSDIEKNYVYHDEFGKLIDQNAPQYDPNDPIPEDGMPDTREPITVTKKEGSYKYDPETYLFTWEEGGSYDFDPSTLTYTFKADGTGAYKLAHSGLGSYEDYIEQLLAKGAFTVECIHSLEKETYARGGMIHSSYVSTMSKYEYLKRQGLWVCSYTDMTQYLRESLNAKVDTTSVTDTEIRLTLTDTLDDHLFDQAITIKVDIPDSWTNVTVAQGGNAIELVSNEAYKDNMLVANCTIMDGYLYVDAVPDCGEIVITVAE